MINITRVHPKSEAELLQHTENIAGLSLGELAYQFNWTIPHNLKHNKGWIGQFLEFLLGTTAPRCGILQEYRCAYPRLAVIFSL